MKNNLLDNAFKGAADSILVKSIIKARKDGTYFHKGYTYQGHSHIDQTDKDWNMEKILKSISDGNKASWEKNKEKNGGRAIYVNTTA